MTQVHWVFGTCKSGKTRYAWRMALALSAQTGDPILVIDPTRDEHFEHLPRASTVVGITRLLWGSHESCVFTPKDAEQMQLMMLCVTKGKDVVLLVDESWEYLSAHGLGRTGSLMKLIRQHRHFRTYVILTAQYLAGDIPMSALAAGPKLHVFRSTATSVLKRLREINRDVFDPDRVKSLKQYEHIQHTDGFST